MFICSNEFPRYLSPLLFSFFSLFSDFLLLCAVVSFTPIAFFISFSGSRISFSLRSLFSFSSSLIPFFFSLASSSSLPVFMYHGVTSVPGWGPRDTNSPIARSCFSWRKQGKPKAFQSCWIKARPRQTTVRKNEQCRHLFFFLFLEILLVAFLLRRLLQGKQIQMFQSCISCRRFSIVASSILKSSASFSPQVLCPCLAAEQNGS